MMVLPMIIINVSLCAVADGRIGGKIKAKRDIFIECVCVLVISHLLNNNLQYRNSAAQLCVGR